jgi:hypothetical protein
MPIICVSAATAYMLIVTQIRLGVKPVQKNFVKVSAAKWAVGVDG